MQMLPHTYKRTQPALAPRVTDGARNCDSVFTLLGQMGIPHCDPDKLFGLRLVKMIYHILVLAVLFWLLMLYL